MVDKELLDVVIEEYKILWDYYKQTQSERRNIYEWYFKIVALPSAVITALFSIGILSVEGSKAFLTGFLSIVFLAGITIFIAYIVESSSSAKYYDDINNIRKNLINICGKEYSGFFYADYTYKKKPKFFSVKFFKSLTVPVLNSGLPLIILNVNFNVGIFINIMFYLIILFFHALMYKMLFNHYSRVGYKNNILNNISK